jgi:hypothetical protein
MILERLTQNFGQILGNLTVISLPAEVADQPAGLFY